MEYLTNLVATVAMDVWTTIQHNWPYLLLSVVIASAIQVFLDPERLAGWLRRRVWIAVLGAVALGALTPFCSCGTTAIVLGALASQVPWAPIVAFMASSPLTSPEEFVFSVGLFGPAFSLTYVGAAIAVGGLGGAAAWWLEKRGWLAGQSRMPAGGGLRPAASGAAADACDSCAPAPEPLPSPAGTRVLTLIDARPTAVTAPSRVAAFSRALVVNTRRLALYFLAFATIGYLLIRLIPAGVLAGWLGEGNPVWSVPLAALVGVPIYLNTEGSLPLVASLLDGGMSPGAALAFLITGAGTSIASIAGMLVIARWRVVALVVASLFVVALATGWLSGLWL